MIETREGALLGGEAAAARGRKPGVAEKFDGDLAAEIFAFGEVDDTHAAFAEEADDFVGAEILEWRLLVGCVVVEDFVCYVGNVSIEQRFAGGVFVEQSLDFGDEGFIALAGGAEVGAVL